jgi:hypothetical protein
MSQEENNGRKPYVSLLKDKKDFPGWSYELMVRLCVEGLWHCISDASSKDSHSRPLTSEEAHSKPLSKAKMNRIKSSLPLNGVNRREEI